MAIFFVDCKKWPSEAHNIALQTYKWYAKAEMKHFIYHTELDEGTTLCKWTDLKEGGLISFWQWEYDVDLMPYAIIDYSLSSKLLLPHLISFNVACSLLFHVLSLQVSKHQAFLVGAPRLSSQVDGNFKNSSLDAVFEERLKAVRRYNCSYLDSLLTTLGR